MKDGRTAVGFCLLVLGLAAITLSEDKKPKPGPLAGTWECVAHASEGDEPFTMVLKQSQQTVRGTITTPNGTLSINSGSYKEKVLEIRVEEGNIHASGKLEGRQLSGDWSKGEGNQAGKWECKVSTEVTR